MKIYLLNKSIFIYQQCLVNNIKVGPIYKDVRNPLLLLFRRLHMKLHMPFYNIWYSREFLEDCQHGNEDVLFFDSVLSVYPANYIKETTNRRVIYWFWNHVYNEWIVENLSNNIEKWSYDKDDCDKYNMRFNTQFGFLSLCSLQKTKVECTKDLFFIGKDKGRSSTLQELNDIASKQNLSCDFRITGNRVKGKNEAKRMSYEEVIREDSCTNCIVDIVPEEQHGLSLRPIEAIMLDKKLITNNKHIINEPWYRESNVLLINDHVENMQLAEFIHADYDSSIDHYKEYYDINNWIKRFN